MGPWCDWSASRAEKSRVITRAALTDTHMIDVALVHCCGVDRNSSICHILIVAWSHGDRGRRIGSLKLLRPHRLGEVWRAGECIWLYSRRATSVPALSSDDVIWLSSSLCGLTHVLLPQLGL
jgi:hypothetical protein